jgi:hypothetical protein
MANTLLKDPRYEEMTALSEARVADYKPARLLEDFDEAYGLIQQGAIPVMQGADGVNLFLHRAHNLTRVGDCLFDPNGNDCTAQGEQILRDLGFANGAELTNAMGYLYVDNHVIQFPPEAIYKSLVFAVQAPYISRAEFDRMSEARIAVIGGSVGGAVIATAAATGLGTSSEGYLAGADPKPLRMNHSRLAFVQRTALGLSKMDALRNQVLPYAPYSNVNLTETTVTPGNILELLGGQIPNVMFDVVDHIPTKIQLHKLAKEWGIPLVHMTNLDSKIVVDTFRYDKGIALYGNDTLDLGRYIAPVDGDTEETIKERELKALISLVGGGHMTDRVIQMMQGNYASWAQRPGNIFALGGLSCDLIEELVLRPNSVQPHAVYDAKTLLSKRGLPDRIAAVKGSMANYSVNREISRY